MILSVDSLEVRPNVVFTSSSEGTLAIIDGTTEPLPYVRQKVSSHVRSSVLDCFRGFCQHRAAAVPGTPCVSILELLHKHVDEFLSI